MDNFTLFVFGIVVTLVAGMGVITSEVFLGYHRFLQEKRQRHIKHWERLKNREEEEDETVEQLV
tara:strand:- start:1475 stop:1666 length:192 start_codon:yes stop_codon:yes gene_type:complete